MIRMLLEVQQGWSGLEQCGSVAEMMFCVMPAKAYFHVFVVYCIFLLPVVTSRAWPRYGGRLSAGGVRAITSLQGGANSDVLSITSLNKFEKILKEESKLVVVDFSAEWCRPCKMIAPIFKTMAASEQFAKTIFVKVDVDKGQEVAKKYEVLSMPTFILIKKGKVLSRFSGADADKLRNEVLKHQ